MAHSARSSDLAAGDPRLQAHQNVSQTAQWLKGASSRILFLEHFLQRTGVPCAGKLSSVVIAPGIATFDDGTFCAPANSRANLQTLQNE
jgi:hypothetical protein